MVVLFCILFKIELITLIQSDRLFHIFSGVSSSFSSSNVSLSLAAGKFCMFIIECWKPASLGYGITVYFVMRKPWLSFLSY